VTHYPDMIWTGLDWTGLDWTGLDSRIQLCSRFCVSSNNRF
jgi:hypothetical protein